MLTGFMAAVAVLALLFVMMAVKIVRQGNRYTIEQFGRFLRVAEPELNYVTPWSGACGRQRVVSARRPRTVGERVCASSISRETA